MPTYTLAIIDTTGIQNYIFGSNKLRENIGASQVVYTMTSVWLKECLDDENVVHGSHNLKPDATIDIDNR